MKKLIAILLLSVYPQILFAEELIKCQEVIPITKPCEGLILPEEAATEALKCLKIEFPECQLELEKEKGLRGLDKTLFETKLKLEQQRADELLKTVQTLLQPKDESFFDTNEFWLLTGVLSGVAVTAGITAIVLTVN